SRPRSSSAGRTKLNVASLDEDMYKPFSPSFVDASLRRFRGAGSFRTHSWPCLLHLPPLVMKVIFISGAHLLHFTDPIVGSHLAFAAEQFWHALARGTVYNESIGNMFW